MHITTILCKIYNQFCIAYLDNIIVYLNTLEIYEEHVKLVFAKLQEACLNSKLSKYMSNLQYLSFIRFVIIPNGIRMEPKRVMTIYKFPKPSCHCNIQVLLRFAN